MLDYVEDNASGGVMSLAAPIATNVVTDPTEDYNQINDTGAESFAGTNPNTYTYFPVFSNNAGRLAGDEVVTFEDLVVTAMKNGSKIQLSTLDIYNTPNSTYIAELDATIVAGDSTPVDPIVVTAHRYNPCVDGTSLTSSNITSHAMETPQHDTMGAMAAQSYTWDVDNPVIPAGFTLQNKYVSPDDGSFIIVAQRDNSNDYAFIARGSNTTGAFVTDGQLFVVPSVATEMVDVKNWFSGVLTTIRNFDPTAHIFISGHSLGGAHAVVGGATAISLGFSASQVQVTALAPWAASNALSAAGLGGYAAAVAPSVTALWHLDDPTYAFRGPEVGNIIKTRPSDAIVGPFGTWAGFPSGHDVCRYVSQM